MGNEPMPSTTDWSLVGAADTLASTLLDFLERPAFEALTRLERDGVAEATTALNELRAALQPGPGTVRSVLDVLDRVMTKDPADPVFSVREP